VHHQYCINDNGINITGSKLAIGIAGAIDIGGKLPPVSMTPAVNLQLVSKTPVAHKENNMRLITP
jgi:hypothetical protein